MTALYRCGRQADALSTYDGFARRLVDEFGLDPSDELRALRQSILTSALDGEWQHQNQLPLDIRNLVGRDDLITEVVDLLTATEGVRIVALSGTPGVGKTAVAVRVARELTERFPDGQWFVRLRGASDQPRHADDVLVELLRASGVDSHAIPDDGDARAALFRSRLATRSILLVLDDAQGRGQVRPLLPGTPTSAVLVTSRNPLDALAALDGGIPIRVPTLTPEAGTALVYSMLQATNDVGELVDLCAGLPLALRIAGAVAARGSVAAFVSRMRRQPRRRLQGTRRTRARGSRPAPRRAVGGQSPRRDPAGAGEGRRREPARSSRGRAPDRDRRTAGQSRDRQQLRHLYRAAGARRVPPAHRRPRDRTDVLRGRRGARREFRLCDRPRRAALRPFPVQLPRRRDRARPRPGDPGAG
ncbi:BTAD domain-containing putative transcriptional regulator [Kribbella sp. NBC_00662]|uniref:BTAD domain-containing putative transcriptional regulator n=1 Tax=Kribbella sp. NBC_00662 TaxID=2975969 RepID=UPI00352A284B